MFLQIILAIIAVILIQYVLRPMWAMKKYLNQGAFNLGYFPVGGLFGRLIYRLNQTNDMYHQLKQLGKIKPKPDFAVSNYLQKEVLYLINIDLIKEFISKNQCYKRSQVGLQMIQPLYGQGIVTANGQQWVKRRKLLSNLFHFSSIKQMGMKIANRSKLLLQKQSIKGKIDIQQISQLSSGQSIMTFIFGNSQKVINLTDKIARCFRQMNTDRLYQQIPFLIMGKNYFKYKIFNKSKQLMNLSLQAKSCAQQLFTIIKQQKQKGLLQQQSMISQYLKIVDKGTFTKDDLLGDIMHLFIAGKDTSSAVISICCYYLCTYPQWQSKIREQIDKAIRYSGFPGILLNRQSIQDHQLLGLHVYKGTIITALVATNFYDEEYFPNSSQFNPDRYLDEKQNNFMMSSLIYLPFGSGQRSCIGKNLALLAIKSFIYNLLKDYNFQLQPGYKFVLTVKVNPLTLIVKKRQKQQ